MPFSTHDDRLTIYLLRRMTALTDSGIAAVGIQVIISIYYANVIGFFKQHHKSTLPCRASMIGFFFAFSDLPLFDKIGYQIMFLLFALRGSAVASLPLLSLTRKE